MAEVEQLIRTTLGEIERILSTKTVVGDPISVEGNTIIPLIAIGFGFGGGGGSGGGKDKAEGAASGSGGGGGVKPIGVIVVSSEGVKVGVVNLTMFRPFPADLVSRLIKGKKGVVVLERVDQPLAVDPPLLREIRAVATMGIENERAGDKRP